MKRAVTIIFCLLLLIGTGACEVKRLGFSNGRFRINGQELFMSGMNLAWMHFGRDITEFDEPKFTGALDDIALKGGNCVRWWIHVNGSTSPLYDKDGKVAVLPPGFTDTFRHALDLAWERGIVVVISLWSFDMLKSNTGVDLKANRKMLEDPVYSKAYVDKALIPMVRALKAHPAVLAWEIFNEPEGMLPSGGWTDVRTELSNLQRFINLTAGAIHRTDPEALVTVGSGLAMTANVGGMMNHYSNDRLIKAGGDSLGFLDFYEAHYYPQNEDEMTSPFHHPASYWKLDKPILIGEFPAFGITEFGKGFRPKTKLMPKESYLYAFENGYAGALSWTWTAHDGFGSVEDAGPGMTALVRNHPENLVIKTGVNRPPLVVKNIDRLIVEPNRGEVPDYVNLKEYFMDFEDGTNLTYSVGTVSKPEILSASVDAGGNLDLMITPGQSGACRIEIRAEDSGGAVSTLPFIVFVYDPTKGNLALFKQATSQSIEGESTAVRFVNDGLDDTRWSSAWVDDQWLMIDLGNNMTVKKFVLNWETAFGREYELSVSPDGKTWKTVCTQKKGEGKIEEITIAPVRARYVKFHGTKRATEWGFSFWEFEVFGQD